MHPRFINAAKAVAILYNMALEHKRHGFITLTRTAEAWELLQTAQNWPIRTGTQALMCFRFFQNILQSSRIDRSIFHSKSAGK